jgi:hypothetical protein
VSDPVAAERRDPVASTPDDSPVEPDVGRGILEAVAKE